MIGFVGGLMAPPVLKLNPDYVDIYYEQAGTYVFTVPNGAKSIDLTVIGSGAGGQEGGISYGTVENAYPAGGAGGAAGEIKHMSHVEVAPGATYQIKVAKAGTAYGGNGESSFFGNMLTAAGGSSGGRGGHEPLNNQSTANGGNGGSGGIGGNGGGAGRGQYSSLLGKDGSDGASSMAWESWGAAEWYAFRDAKTGKRLGNGGRGGDGYAIYADSSRKEIGKSVAEIPGTCYGGGGRGGDQRKTGPVKTPTAGQNGLVAIRVWYKRR